MSINTTNEDNQMAEEQKPTFFNNVIKEGVSNIVGAGKDIWSGAKQLGSNLRLAKDALTKGAQTPTKSVTSASMDGSNIDWRVRLSIPSSIENVLNQASRKETQFLKNIMLPLQATRGFIFPYTPQITISHTANYSTMSPVHSNYPFLSYENSRVDEMSIVGDFYCEDSSEAAYWMAAVHYLRTVTKMDYGAEATGGPPPVVKLYGYGDYVFNGVPVVVRNFMVDMPKDVDYIPAQVTSPVEIVTDFDRGLSDKVGVGYVPVKSTITVNVMPVYSRTEIRNFNLNDFIKGTYIQGEGTKFI